MNDHLKNRARRLRTALAEYGTDVTHGQALDLVAREMGRRNWNTLQAESGRRKDDLLAPLPEPWRVVRSPSWEDYELGVDRAEGGAFILRSRVDADLEPNAFASLMAESRIPSDILPVGVRTVTLRADLRCRNAQTGTIWLRFDGADGQSLSFENLMRPEKPFGGVKGTMDWETREFALAVPVGASRMCYGILLKGEGELQARAVTISPA